MANQGIYFILVRKLDTGVDYEPVLSTYSFQRIIKSLLSDGKCVTPQLFSLEVSDKVRIFVGTFSETCNLDDLGIFLSTFSSETNVIQFNSPLTPRIAENCS